jgi:predicted nucleic acid-binding protein
MTPVVLDASLWVSRLVPQDVFHTPVKAWLEAQRKKGRELLSPSLLLPEVGGAISRRTGSSKLAQEAVEILQHLTGVRLIEMDGSLIGEAAALASNLGLRGADSTYVAVAYRLDLPLATLDEDQLDRASQVVMIEALSGIS